MDDGEEGRGEGSGGSHVDLMVKDLNRTCMSMAYTYLYSIEMSEVE